MSCYSSVGIAIGYGLDGPGIESRWGRYFPHLSITTLGPIQPPVQWVPGLSRGWRAAGAWRWPLAPSSAMVMNGLNCTSNPPMDRTACRESQRLYIVNFTFTFSICIWTGGQSKTFKSRLINYKLTLFKGRKKQFLCDSIVIGPNQSERPIENSKKNSNKDQR